MVSRDYRDLFMWKLRKLNTADLLDNPGLGVELAEQAADALDMAHTLCEQLGEDAFVEDSFREQARAFLRAVSPSAAYQQTKGEG